MIYLDNAATSFPKPKGMVMAMEECMLQYCGNPGRSGHLMSLKTGEGVYKARRSVADLFHIKSVDRLVFTKNTTEALNMGLHGFLRKGDHVITTSMEHNSVLRPLKALEKAGIDHTVVKGDRLGMLTAADLEKAIRPNTRLIVVTAASNITGGKMPLEAIGKMAKRRRLTFMVDGAQGAGSMDIDVQTMHIKMLAIPGHKGLLGPLGTGALYVDPSISMEPLMEGGTGTESKNRLQPKEFPEGYESGTINAPGIIALGHSVEFVSKVGVEVIGRFEEELIQRLDENLMNMDFVRLYGPKADRKTGISLINIEGMDAEEVTSRLSQEYGIAVRGGFHCAGLAHKTLGTWNQGAVRISVGPYNNRKDIEAVTNAIWTLGKNRV